MALLFFLIFASPAFAHQGASVTNGPLAACEFELMQSDQLLTETQKLHQVLTEHRFHVRDAAPRMGLRKFFNVDISDENIGKLNVDFRETDNGYRMRLIYGRTILHQIHFGFPPLLVWPGFNLDRRLLDSVMLEEEDPLATLSDMVRNSTTGTILDVQWPQRLYLETAIEDGKTVVHLGVDFPTDHRVVGSRWLRTASGVWLRRTRVLTLAVDE